MSTSFLAMKFIQARGIMRLSPEMEVLGFDNMHNENQGEAYQLKAITEGIDSLKEMLKSINSKKEDKLE